MTKTLFNTLEHMITKFKIQEATGLNLNDALVVVQDLMDVQSVNLLQRKRFLQTKKRALILPHCSRKYMDGRVQSHIRCCYSFVRLRPLFTRLQC